MLGVWGNQIRYMNKKYYEAPSDEIFEEVRQKAMKLWDVIDVDGDKYGYATEKKNRIKDIGNVSDNLMYIVAMYDYWNQRKLAKVLSAEARLAISERLEAVGSRNVFRV